MAMILLRARRIGFHTIILKVWLDNSKFVGGEPDPEWVREWVHGPINGESLPSFKSRVIAETRLLAIDALSEMNGPQEIILPEEGSVL